MVLEPIVKIVHLAELSSPAKTAVGMQPPSPPVVPVEPEALVAVGKVTTVY
jgi:hypothetical protein